MYSALWDHLTGGGGGNAIDDLCQRWFSDIPKCTGSLNFQRDNTVRTAFFSLSMPLFETFSFTF